MKHTRALAFLLGACLVLLSPFLLVSPLGPIPAHSDMPWDANVMVNDDSGSAGQYSPNIAVDAAGNAYVVWTDCRNNPPNMTPLSADIYSSRRDVATGLWSANVRVNDDTGWMAQESPAIALDAAGNAYAVWVDSRNGGSDIYFSRRDAATGLWGLNGKVNDDSGTAGQYSPTIAVDAAGNAYVVWTDCRNNPPNMTPLSADIYSSRRDATTGAWSANVRVNDDVGSASQEYPALALDAAGNAYAVWRDERNGNQDIYFSRLPEASLVPTWTATPTSTPTSTPLATTPTPAPGLSLQNQVFLPIVARHASGW